MQLTYDTIYAHSSFAGSDASARGLTLLEQWGTTRWEAELGDVAKSLYFSLKSH